MTQTTEAACLLQSGSMYSRRLGLKTPSGEEVFAGVKPGGVSVYFGDAPIYHFDLDGRWQRAFVSRTHYLKSLDATVRSIDRDREGASMVLRRVTLPYAEAADLDASIRSVALTLINDLASKRLEVLSTPGKARPFTPEEFREFLERVATWDSAAWFAHRERYLSTYGPLPFLPPDLPNPLVLQATLGHTEGRAFGGARAAEHYVRSPSEFLEHARSVARLTGRRIAQHRGIFLGGADVLRRPMAELTSHLKTIARVFPVNPDLPSLGGAWDDFPGKPGPIHVFLDDFAPPLPDLEGWRALRSLHLGQVTLGVESGDPAIRARFGKSWRDEALVETIAHLKTAEIRVALVVLVGIGGVDATAGLLEALPLDPGDLVTLVDARSLDEPEAEPAPESVEEVAALKARVNHGPKIVAYNPAKRWA